MKRYIIIGILILAVITFGKLYFEMRADRNRLRGNQEDLLRRTSLFQKEAAESAENVRQLTLKIQELKAGRPELVKKIKDKGVRPKDIQNITITVAEAKAEIKAPLQEEIRMTDTIPKIISKIEWTDGYFTLKGVIEDKILTGSGTYRDTLFQTLYRVPKKFLFIRWGTKEVRQVAKFSNPNAKIVYQEVLKVEK